MYSLVECGGCDITTRCGVPMQRLIIKSCHGSACFPCARHSCLYNALSFSFGASGLCMYIRQGQSSLSMPCVCQGGVASCQSPSNRPAIVNAYILAAAYHHALHSCSAFLVARHVQLTEHRCEMRAVSFQQCRRVSMQRLVCRHSVCFILCCVNAVRCSEGPRS